MEILCIKSFLPGDKGHLNRLFNKLYLQLRIQANI